MKKLLLTGISAYCLIALSGCKSRPPVYIPVETVKVEYRDRELRDSVRLYDSVFVLVKGDTVRLEKYKYLYRDKLVRDSIFRSDTIRVPYPVVEEKEVNRPTGWQWFQIYGFRIFLTLTLIFIIWKKVKK